jgi:hypothetical protein
VFRLAGREHYFCLYMRWRYLAYEAVKLVEYGKAVGYWGNIGVLDEPPTPCRGGYV